MKITVLYVGTSLLSPLKRAEEEIARDYRVTFQVAAHNCGGPFSDDEWRAVGRDIIESSIIFIIHVTDDENARLIASELDRHGGEKTIIAFNCMSDLMRLTRMGKLDFASLMKSGRSPKGGDQGKEASTQNLARRLGSWMSDSFRGRKKGERKSGNHSHYVKLIGKLPTLLKFIPSAGRVRDIKHYLFLFSYFLQPTPRNIRSMLLYASKHYGEPGMGYPASRVFEKIKVEAPENLPAVGIYHPDATKLFASFAAYQSWYERTRKRRLEPHRTVGLLLMRPQIISDARRHYDFLIRSIEAEGLSVIPAISTFMDNREACREFFTEGMPKQTTLPSPVPPQKVRVSQIISLTGFSFVGGPAMNDSEAAVEFFTDLKVPFRSLVSLDFQSVENWRQSRLGVNPVQTAMQVAIPELDGATEAFVFGGLGDRRAQPEPIEERCRKIARRLAKWNRLQTAAPAEKRLALVLFCFPPNKGNIGTAADLDVFASTLEILRRLQAEGYAVELPEDADRLREMVIAGNSEEYGTVANVAHRLSVDNYRRLCPYVDEIEEEWGRAPGTINTDGRDVLILGAQLGNVFLAVQPTFGYEGDPMRLLSAESGAPHHGFMGLYTYIEKVFQADAVVHVGTHGSLEFMPGKQVGLSTQCWPDRLIGDLPNLYLYSVNNPSEGTIAKRRSYAELVSYLTPPIENAGLYKELATMKDLLSAYRQSGREDERAQLFAAIEEKAKELHL